MALLEGEIPCDICCKNFLPILISQCDDCSKVVCFLCSVDKYCSECAARCSSCDSVIFGGLRCAKCAHPACLKCLKPCTWCHKTKICVACAPGKCTEHTCPNCSKPRLASYSCGQCFVQVCPECAPHEDPVDGLRKCSEHFLMCFLCSRSSALTTLHGHLRACLLCSGPVLAAVTELARVRRDLPHDIIKHITTILFRSFQEADWNKAREAYMITWKTLQ